MPLPPLHVAAKRGDLAAVQRLLHQGGVDVNKRVINVDSGLKRTPILLAACSRNAAVVEALLCSGASPNPRWGLPPLHAAAYNNCLEMMDLLIAAGADLNSTDNTHGLTAMSDAMGRRPPAIEAVRKLVTAGADVNTGSNLANLPMVIAVIDKNHEATKLLLKAHANPCLPDDKGLLHGALKHAHDEYGVDPGSNETKEALEMVAALIAAGNRSWDQLPMPCPRLERALPAVAATSPRDLTKLFKHLSADVKARIRCTLLLLKRYIPEKRLRGRILTATLADDGEELPLSDWLPDSILDRIRMLDI